MVLSSPLFEYDMTLSFVVIEVGAALLLLCIKTLLGNSVFEFRLLQNSRLRPRVSVVSL